MTSEPRPKIILIGDLGVGKTTMIMRYVDGQYLENIRESIVTGQPIHYSDPDNNRIALKVEHYLCQMMQEGYPRDAFILKTYYLSRDSANLGYIAKLLDCKPYQVEGIVKGSLYRLSCFWND